jgi:hypothetical protein
VVLVVSGKHAFSLAIKLATLDVGDSIWLPDTDPLAERRLIATDMERQVQDRIAKSPKLTGQSFSTTRADAITVGRNHHVLLRIERTI